jgi:hypothetical protein
VISSDLRGPPVPTAVSVQSYMLVGPPDLLLYWTHKCLKLALTLRSLFWDVMLLAWHTVTMFQRNFFREPTKLHGVITQKTVTLMQPLPITEHQLCTCYGQIPKYIQPAMCLDKLQCDDSLLTALNVIQNKNSLYSLFRMSEHTLHTLSIHSIQVHIYNFLLEEGRDEPGAIHSLKIMVQISCHY